METPTAYSIAETLADEIGRLRAGERIASEQELMTRFGVSRSTVRAAITELETMHLIRRVQGAGSFVNERIDYVISRRQAPSLHKTIELAGARAKTILIDSATLPLPEPIAARLDTEPERLTQRLVRLSFVNDMESGYVEEWVNDGVCAHVDVALMVTHSVDDTLRASGFTPVRSWCRASLGIPPAEVGDRLGLVRHQQAWIVESVARDALTGRALLHSTAWTRQDTMRLVFELDEEPTAAGTTPKHLARQ